MTKLVIAFAFVIGCSSPTATTNTVDAGAGLRTSYGGQLAPQGGTIVSVLPTANRGLAGGGVTGSITLGLLATCSDTQVLQWSSGGSSWGCATGVNGAVSGTTNTTAKFTGANAIGNGWALDDATNWGVSGKFQILESTGAVTASSTLAVTGATTLAGMTATTGSFSSTLGATGLVTATAGVTTPANYTTTGTGSLVVGGTGTASVAGLSTLTGGFTSGAASSMGSFKITSLANGTASSDAAAFGQISSGINTAVSGTTNTTAKFTGPNAVGNGWALDDGTNWGVAGKFTIAESSGGTTVSGTILANNGIVMGAAGDNYFYDTLAASAGNQWLDIDAAGTGVIRFNSNTGSLANAGTGGLALYGGNNGSTAVWIESAAGNQVNNGTLNVAGLSTLTGGFTSGAASSMGSFKITSLANGTAAQDAAAFGQISTGINGAVSGTTNTTAKFTGANAVGNGWALDDGTNWGVSGKFQILESTGAVTASSTLGVTGLSTLTGGFQSAANSIIAPGSSGAAVSIAGTSLTLDNASTGPNYLTIKAADAQVSGLVFNNVTNGAADGYLIYNNSSRQMALAVAGTQQVQIVVANTKVLNALINNSTLHSLGAGTFDTTLAVTGLSTLTGGFLSSTNSTINASNSGADTFLKVINPFNAAGTTASLHMQDGAGDAFLISSDLAGATTSLKAINRNSVMSLWTGAGAGAEAININGSQLVAMKGAATVAGTLGVTGLSTLTGGFTLGADSSANSHKITSLTNGSSAQDAAAFGQISTAVTAAVSGTTNTIAMFTGANTVGNATGNSIITLGSSGAGAALAGTALTFENNGNVYLTFKAPNANDEGILFNNVSGAADGSIIYDNLMAGARTMDFRTGGNVSRMVIGSAGALEYKFAATFDSSLLVSGLITGTAGGVLKVASGPVFSSVNTPALASYDTTSMAAGVGGQLTLYGNYTGTTSTSGAAIKAMKTNGTDGDYGFDLVFGTRLNGSSQVTEAMRIAGTGAVTMQSTLGVTGLSTLIGQSLSVAGLFAGVVQDVGDLAQTGVLLKNFLKTTDDLTSNAGGCNPLDTWGICNYGGGSTITLTTSTQTSPRGVSESVASITCADGTTVCTAGGSDVRAYSTKTSHGIADTRNKAFTASVWLKWSAGTVTPTIQIARYQFNVNAVTQACAGINSSTWTRCSVTFTANSTSYADNSVVAFLIQPFTAAATLYAYGAQLEQGPVSTPYQRNDATLTGESGACPLSIIGAASRIRVNSRQCNAAANGYTLQFVNDGAGAGSLTDGPVAVFHYSGTTTVTNMGTALAASAYMVNSALSAGGDLVTNDVVNNTVYAFQGGENAGSTWERRGAWGGTEQDPLVMINRKDPTSGSHAGITVNAPSPPPGSFSPTYPLLYPGLGDNASISNTGTAALFYGGVTAGGQYDTVALNGQVNIGTGGNSLNTLAITEATTMSLTLGVTGVATLTGGFTSGATSSMGSFKITSLANGSASTDAAAFGQIAAGVLTPGSSTVSLLADQTQWSPTNLSTSNTIIVTSTSAANRTIRGILSTGVVTGRTLTIQCSTGAANALFFTNQDGTAAAGDRLATLNAAQQEMDCINGTISFVYLTGTGWLQSNIASTWMQAAYVNGGLDVIGAAIMHSSLSTNGTSLLTGNVTFGAAGSTFHIMAKDAGASRPTLANCGTGAALVGNDESGVVTTGTTAGNCAITFGTAYSSSDSCTVTPRDGTFRAYAVVGASITITAASSSQKYDYECRDH